MMTVFLGYIRQHLKSIIVFLVLSVIFAAVLYLYNLPAEAVGYAVLLCAFFLFFFVIIDFYYFYRKHKQLIQAQKEITYQFKLLPPQKNLIEQDYHSLAETAYTDKINAVSSVDAEKRNTIEYYTLWAHQIKTPIAAMRLLLQEKETEENKALLAELFRIEQYVEMVLSYLRLDSDYSDLVIKAYPLDAIVKQAVRKYAALFIGKKIKLELKEINDTVITDEKWLSFVIEQLLSNALKYTNKGGAITIYTQPQKKLIIEDNGIGIATEDLPRIFDNGFTGYNGRSDKKASGIGLYLCKRILVKLSHKIEITSQLKKSTRVCLDLHSTTVQME